jgi:acyl-CoA-binding protein
MAGVLDKLSKTEGFWTNSVANDPKRGFRFTVQLGTAGILWYAKKATKPAVSFTETSHNYLNHTYYWPARAEWNEVDITLVDPVEPDLAGTLVAAIQAMGYNIPFDTEALSGLATVSKDSATKQFNGAIIIKQIDHQGTPLETWTLKNAWIKEVTFGDLDYSTEDLTEVTIKFRYDWATFKGKTTDEVWGNAKAPSPPKDLTGIK